MQYDINSICIFEGWFCNVKLELGNFKRPQICSEIIWPLGISFDSFQFWYFPSPLHGLLCLLFAIKTFVFAYQFTMLTHFPTFFCQVNFRLTLLFSWLEDLYTSYSSLAYQTSLLGLWDEYPFFCHVACFFSFIGHPV